MDLRLEAISFARRSSTVIREVTVTIPGRGLTCLLGANGAGKTTLLQLLSGELRATSGKYFIGDTDTSNLSRRELAPYFAIIPQNAPTPPYLTVKELVGLGLFRPTRSLWWQLNQTELAAVDACLTRCQVAQLRDRPLEELSGGERQRAWLAFGLVPAKDFLILDETLAGMDFFIKRSFFQLLREIAQDGKSILLATHDLELVTEFADKIIVMVDGRVSYEGVPHDNLHELVKAVNGFK